VLDIPDEHVEEAKAEMAAAGAPVEATSFRRQTISCTGIEFCRLSVSETKQVAAEIIDHLEHRLGDIEPPVRINVNGCPNACARTQVADIGLKGMLVLDDHGDQVEGFQVHLGGALGLQNGFGKKLRGHKITSAGLDDYVTTVVGNYLHDRQDEETFATWAARADDVLLNGEKDLS